MDYRTETIAAMQIAATAITLAMQTAAMRMSFISHLPHRQPLEHCCVLAKPCRQQLHQASVALGLAVGVVPLGERMQHL
jgi:hypothetical protein